MPIMQFTDVCNQVPDLYWPVPAKNVLPNWFKHLEPYIGGTKKMSAVNRNNSTAKRCVPLYDAISAGYLIVTYQDIIVTQIQGVPFFEWATGEGIEFHNAAQSSTHPLTPKTYETPKWVNPWSIETPAGYSSLITAPLNRDLSPIQIFSGLVDTDVYLERIHLPFVLTPPNFEGLIPAGTPIAQVIPIKREKWTHDLKIGLSSGITRTRQLWSSRFINAYRELFWKRKDYS